MLMLILQNSNLLNPTYQKKHEMDETPYLQLYDFERKVKEFQDISKKCSIGDTCIDKLLKLKDTHTTSSSTTVVVHAPSLTIEIFDDKCTIDVLSEKNFFSLMFKNFGFFSSSNFHREPSDYCKNILNHIE